MSKSFVLLILLIVNCRLLYAQVAINSDGTAPNNSAMLDVKSTVRGFLPPRMTYAQMNAIASPATGLMVYVTDDNQFYTNKGTPAIPNWLMASTQWKLNGTALNFTGGNVGIGTTNPTQTLTVNGSFTYSMTQNDVKTTRSLNTVYQNTTGRIMYVNVTTYHSVVGTTTVYCDNNAVPVTNVSANSGNVGYNRFNFFIVLPNYYYKVFMDTGGTIASWIEWY